MMEIDGKTGKREWCDLAETIVKRAADLLWTPQGVAALDYLRGRGFADDWIRRAELGFIPKYTEWQGLRIPAGISIPSRSDGIVTQIRVRNPKPAPGKPKYLSVSGGKLRASLWGIDWINPNRGVLVFEGEFNALTALQMGFNAVATTSATNKIDQPAHMAKLLTVPWLMSWFDADGAGDTARANLPRCDCHLDMFDDLNGLVMQDKRLGTDFAREWLTDRIFSLEDELPPEKRYLDDSTLAPMRAHSAGLEAVISGGGFAEAFVDILVAEGLLLDFNQVVSLSERPRPVHEQPVATLEPQAHLIEVEQQTLFARPTQSQYSYGA